MTIGKIANLLDARILTGDKDDDIIHFYAGDFLSHVIAGAPSGCAWFTIMNNINVAGVAVMADIKAIIICEGIEPIDLLVEKCKQENIAVIASPLPIFICAAKISSNM